MYMFMKMALRRKRLYAAVYGEANRGERMRAGERLSDAQEDCSYFPTAPLISDTWRWVMFRYNIYVADGGSLYHRTVWRRRHIL